MSITANASLSLENAETNQPIEDLSFNSFLCKNFKLGDNNATSFNFSTEHNIILIQFCLQGKCAYKGNNAKKNIVFKNSEHNILYIPKGNFMHSPSGNNVHCPSIYLEEDFFFRHIPEDHWVLKNKDINSLKPIFSKNLFINPKLKSILNEIETCEFNGHLKMLYMKAKIIELLILQLAQHGEEQISISPTGLKPLEIERMTMVKQLIENNPAQTYSLAYLARTVGTNEQYLKKHFKILFGYTVFGYILSCKMQKAKDLLLTEKYRITEIAEIVGYRHATHFTSAFKKFFGYLPQMLKTKTLVGGWLSLNIGTEFIIDVLIVI